MAVQHNPLQRIIVTVFCFVVLATGYAQNKQAKKNIVILDGDKKEQKLTASFAKFDKNTDTAWTILFTLSVPQPNRNIIDSLNNRTVEDSMTSIEITLKTGELIRFKKSQHGQLTLMGQVLELLFVAFLNPEQKELLSQNSIQKISFRSGDDHHEYIIKDRYADKLKDLLRLPAAD